MTCGPGEGQEMERRTFLKWMTHGLGAVFAAVLGFPAIAYLLDPRHRKAAASNLRTVARLSQLKVNEPVQSVIRDTRRDAFVMHADELVGRVWLIRRDTGAVDAFTTECPHLGCSINLNDDRQGFTCPCHTGQFDLWGNRVGVNPVPPRGMDSLRVELTEDPDPEHQIDDPANPGQKINDMLVRIEFKKFINNRPDKVERT